MTVSRDRLWGGLYAVFAASLFTMLNLSIRLAEPFVNVWQMTFARGLFGVAVALFAARRLKINLWGRRRADLLVIGLVNTAAVICLMIALFLLPLFEALVLLYLYPVFSALFSPRLAGDRITTADWFLIGLAFAGAILILWPESADFRLEMGHAFGLASGFGHGLTFTLIRRLGPDNDQLSPYFYFAALAALACAGPMAAQTPVFPAEPAGLVGLLAVAACACSAQLANFKALSLLPSPQVGVISTFEVVLGGILGYVLFDELLSGRAMFGSGLIIAAGAALNLLAARGKGR